MNKSYCVFCGRFQPFHNAHKQIIDNALKIADEVCVIIGSYRQTPTVKNPWTYEMREAMIRSCYSLAENDRIKVAPMRDFLYNDNTWITSMMDIIAKMSNHSEKVKIIGHKKDLSSDYLDMFPQWGFEEVELIEPLNATNIRDLFFKRDANMKFIKHVVPSSTFDILVKFKEYTTDYEQIIREREFIANYKKQYASLPYPPIFVTTDALVVCSGHILLVERKAFPGKGLWALPGGFLNPTERITQGAVRELKEETKIKVPTPVLEGSIKRVQVFDHPDRSTRGRTITHCFLIELPDGELPKVKGSDDAKTAQWIPISQIDGSIMYEDHAQMIQEMLGV